MPPTFVALLLRHQSSHCLQLLHLPIWIAIITCLVAFCFSLPSAANVHNMDCYHHLPCGMLLLSWTHGLAFWNWRSVQHLPHGILLYLFASMWVSVVFVGATREHCGDHASSRLCSTLTPASGWRLLDAFMVAFYNDSGLGPETPARFHCCSRWGSLSGSMLQMESTPLRPGGQQPYKGVFRGRRLLAPRPTYPSYNLQSLISLETCVALEAFPPVFAKGMAWS